MWNPHSLFELAFRYHSLSYTFNNNIDSIQHQGKVFFDLCIMWKRLIAISM